MQTSLRQTQHQTQHQTLLENRRIILGWGIGWLVACALIAGAALLKIHSDRQELLEHARSEAGARATHYAEQVMRAVSQIDQLSMSIKYQWEQRRGRMDLEEQYRKGVYQRSLYPVVISADGHAVYATRRLNKGTYMGDLEFFATLKNRSVQGLLISHPAQGRGGLAGTQVIRFSRALVRSDGRFDGAVLIAVESTFIAGHQDSSRLRVGDFMSVYFNDGTVLTSQSGGGSVASFYRSPPSMPASDGALYQTGELFTDGRSRLVGWKRLEAYPLIVVAAISEDNALSPYRSTQSTYIGIAIAVSVLMGLFCAAGAWSQLRTSARRRHDSQVQTTFRLAVDGAREAFLMIHPTYHADGRIDQLLIEDCNERAAEILGYPRNKLIGKCCTELYQGPSLQDVRDFFARVLKEGFVEDEFHVARGKRHAPGWFQRRAVRSGMDVAITIRDVSEAKQQAETLATLARTDSLTGLPNRHWLNDYLPGAIARASERGRKLALYYVDLDNFKDINDSLGHKSGDDVLFAVAKGLSAAMRAGDHLARIGGDEFLAVIEDLTDEEDARRIAAKLNDAVNLEDTLMPWRGFVPKASIGVSVFPDHGQDMDSLLQSADIAMYQAKSEGKSRFCFYSEEFAQRVRDRISTERALELAIANDEFVIYYQPRADARTGLLSSMEALVRWRHPQRGLVAPIEFIPVAEHSRLIVPLGDLVIRKVCEQLMQWREEGLSLRPVSVNVSALQLHGDGLRLSLAANLSRFALPSSLIAIELTESSMLEEGGNGFEELRRLREMGVELQIDDFGTGYSSLSKLQSLDIDVVKIDQSFVYKLATDHQSRALCEAVVSIGRNLNIDIVAEGVETAEQLQLLRQMGCDEIQGYLVSRPVPADEIPSLMDRKFF